MAIRATRESGVTGLFNCGPPLMFDRRPAGLVQGPAGVFDYRGAGPILTTSVLGPLFGAGFVQ